MIAPALMRGSREASICHALNDDAAFLAPQEVKCGTGDSPQVAEPACCLLILPPTHSFFLNDSPCYQLRVFASIAGSNWRQQLVFLSQQNICFLLHFKVLLFSCTVLLGPYCDVEEGTVQVVWFECNKELFNCLSIFKGAWFDVPEFRFFVPIPQSVSHHRQSLWITFKAVNEVCL